MKKVLLVEDDEQIGGHLRSVLTHEAFLVDWVTDVSGLQAVIQNKKSFDVIVLDRLLGTQDSKDLLPQMRKTWPQQPMIVVSAINTPLERAELINLGVDDYVGKPYNSQELVARINALLRRQHPTTTRYLQRGNMVLDLMSRTLSADGRTEVLPAKEFLLLQVLASEQGRVWSKDQLLEVVWGNSLNVATNVVESTMTNIRKKLQEMGVVAQIKNMRNTGYWLEG